MILAMIYSLRHKNDHDITHEDPITSTIIGTLLHLPDQLLWEILREACYANSVLPEDPGELESYEFWPKWDPEGTDNTNYVEPDVFLKFSGTNLIIEAKRADGGGQYWDQWERELIAYESQNEPTDTPVFLLSIGGNGSNTANERTKINGQERIIVKCSWVNLYEILEENLEKATGSNRRIIDALLIACDLFGIRSYQWLDARPWISDIRIGMPDDYHNLIFAR